MKKITGFIPLEREQLSGIDKTDILTIEENGEDGEDGEKKKFYKPLYERLKQYQQAESYYVIQKNKYLKRSKEHELEKCQKLYRNMIHSKINLIREHMFQMTGEEVEQARKTIDTLMTYSFEMYIKTWKTSVENGSKWVTEQVYP